MSVSSYAASTYTGETSCGKVIEYDNNDNPYIEERVVSWFLGFYSGLNAGLAYEGEITFDRESIYYAIVKFCKENPLKDTAGAAVDIYFQVTD